MVSLVADPPKPDDTITVAPESGSPLSESVTVPPSDPAIREMLNRNNMETLYKKRFIHAPLMLLHG
jgi:hypothetical protein